MHTDSSSPPILIGGEETGEEVLGNWFYFETLRFPFL
jgi:hypothetical protein